jgi:hypothetical protein
MSSEESQELAILNILIANKIDTFSYNTVPEINDVIGKGSWAIFNRMAAKGIFIDLEAQTDKFMLTDAGRATYKFLCTQKKKERRLNQVFFWTLVAAIVAAVASVMGLFK